MTDAAGGTVLVVDDDDDVRTVVAWRLETDGFATAQAHDGLQALECLANRCPVLVVLDLSLPGLGGLDLLRRIREGRTPAPSDLPVLILSGRSGETDRIVGLDLGADDYLVKPFSPGELAARVRSLLRRSRVLPDSQSATDSRLQVDLDTHAVHLDGQAIELTAKEFELLAYLAAHPRRVFTRAQLLGAVWRSSSTWQVEATVTEHVHRLRVKLEGVPAAPRMLRTVRGVGYQLDLT